jgi:hypothetical protein
MTDEEMENAPELKEFLRGMRMAGRALDALSNRSGRRLTIYVASGSPCVIDADRQNELDPRAQKNTSGMLTDGGCQVFIPPYLPGNWDGGDW